MVAGQTEGIIHSSSLCLHGRKVRDKVLTALNGIRPCYWLYQCDLFSLLPPSNNLSLIYSLYKLILLYLVTKINFLITLFIITLYVLDNKNNTTLMSLLYLLTISYYYSNYFKLLFKSLSLITIQEITYLLQIIYVITNDFIKLYAFSYMNDRISNSVN